MSNSCVYTNLRKMFTSLSVKLVSSFKDTSYVWCGEIISLQQVMFMMIR